MAIKINPDPINYWMQLKLISPQLQKLYWPADYSNAQSFNNFELDLQYSLQENHSSLPYNFPYWEQSKGLMNLKTENLVYDSSLLNGDAQNVIMKENISRSTPKSSKIQERMSSFSSTWKSTSNSHQENIPSSSVTRCEELKFELSTLFKNNQDQMWTDKASKSNKKNQKIKKLDVLNKIREPLSVRKFDKNSQALWIQNESSNKNSVFLSSTLPAKWLWFDLLNEQSMDDSNSKIAEINSSF